MYRHYPYVDLEGLSEKQVYATEIFLANLDKMSYHDALACIERCDDIIKQNAIVTFRKANG